MKITGITLVNFRNYISCSLKFTKMINIFYGQNAQGKTNLLEAMFFASLGQSHRTGQEDDLINFSKKEMLVKLDFLSLYMESALKIKRQDLLNKKIKEIFIDNVKVSAKEHYGTLNMVMFSPEDLQLIKSEPALRRKFLDMQIAQIDKVYYELLVKYNRILKQRNKLLKELRENNSSENQLDLWDHEFVLAAAEIIVLRLKNLVQIESHSQNIYGNLTLFQEKFTIKYEIKINNEQIAYPEENFSQAYWQKFLETELKKRRKLDIIRGSTGIGPHRDDLIFSVNDKNLRSFGSQGQQRTAALSLKLAQLEYIKQIKSEYPILLLDDVMSELDAQRRKELLNFIDGKVQTFITVNDKSLIPSLPDNAYFYIENGQIKVE